MVLGTIAAKSYGVALEERSLVLEPGVAYQRLSSLPDDWKSCKIAAVLSFTNLSEQNGLPNAELVSTDESKINSPYLGLTDGNGMPTRGCKFVGLSNSRIGGVNGGHGLYMEGNSAKLIGYYGGYNWFPAPCWSNGNASNGANSSNDFSAYTSHKPAQESGFCFSLSATITAENDGSLSLVYFGASNQSNPLMALNGALAGAPSYTYNVGGGWWNNTTTFAGCRHLFIRWPFLNNRLRIHALKVMQLA